MFDHAFARPLTAVALALLAMGCSDRDRDRPAPDPAPAQAPRPAPNITAEAINAAVFTPPQSAPATAPPARTDNAGEAPDVDADADTPDAPDPAIARLQIMLDRTRFSPGVIDGYYGENVRLALAAFAEAEDIPFEGELTQTLWDSLVQRTSGPAIVAYTLTEADVRGPFTASIPESMEAKARLDRLGYTSAAEAVAERFHMDEDLLRALNPQADFSRAGTTIQVAAPQPTALNAEVARIVINKAESSVRAYDASGRLLAFYPATIGSSALPSPSGSMTVKGVAPAPTYTYDPSRLSYAEGGEVLTIAAGPNNPVGSRWIDLSRETYGIHGTPDPSLVGKTASHGCVRLTNWDVEELADAVAPGVRVEFS